MARSLWNDERGFILSAELVLILTVGVLAVVVGLHAVAKAINHELVDIASAFGNINQTFTVSGFKVECKGKDGCTLVNAAVSGSGFVDDDDTCDCAVLVHTPPVVKRQGQQGSG